MQCNKFIYSEHAADRLFERNIDAAYVESIALNGLIIANYETDKPFPSVLVLGFVGKRPIHVVIAQTPNKECIIITAYEPDKNKWNKDFTIKIK